MWVDTLYHRFKERGSWLRASLYIRFERDTSNDQPFHLGKESNRLFLSLKIYHEWVLHFMCTKKVLMFFSSFWFSERPNSKNAELVLSFLVFFFTLFMKFLIVYWNCILLHCFWLDASFKCLKSSFFLLPGMEFLVIFDDIWVHNKCLHVQIYNIL